jgi:hypothetical protein
MILVYYHVMGNCSSNKTVIISRVCLLPSIFLTIMPYLPIPHMEIIRTPIYVVPFCVLSAVLLFHSFACFTNYLYERSVKFSDLMDETEFETGKKERYLRYHRYFTILLSACLIGLLIYYYQFIYVNTDGDYITLLILVRGIITYYFDIQHMISRYVKTLLHKHKKRLVRKRTFGSPSFVASTPTPKQGNANVSAMPPLRLNESSSLSKIVINN